MDLEGEVNQPYGSVEKGERMDVVVVVVELDGASESVLVVDSGTVVVTNPPEFCPTQQAEGRIGLIGSVGEGAGGTTGLGRVPV
jgi:hypothetical protein